MATTPRSKPKTAAPQQYDPPVDSESPLSSSEFSDSESDVDHDQQPLTGIKASPKSKPPQHLRKQVQAAKAASSSNTGRIIGIGVAVVALIALLIGGAIWAQKTGKFASLGGSKSSGDETGSTSSASEVPPTEGPLGTGNSSSSWTTSSTTAPPPTNTLTSGNDTTPSNGNNLTSTSGAKFYTSLVAFGASYTENAHARDQKYKSSLRDYAPFNKYGGRYTNGMVAVEYLVQKDLDPPLPSGSNPINLLDYAYGGALVDNSIGGSESSPSATKDQVVQFLFDLKSNTTMLGQGRTLIYFNIGINSIADIWTSAISSKLTSEATTKASDDVTSNLNSLASQLMAICSDPNLGRSASNGVDLLIVGIPPLGTIPTYTLQVDNDQRSIAALKTLSDQYNAGVKKMTTNLKSGAHCGSEAMFYDLSALWKDMYADSSDYGIQEKPVTTPCYNSKTGEVCNNPQDYLYFDTLHPVTSVHQIMAQKFSSVFIGQSSQLQNDGATI
ncbi:hypothetical protein T439DRAFT_376882 [Meredithblackwellia eburnea MCA 4105]